MALALKVPGFMTKRGVRAADPTKTGKERIEMRPEERMLKTIEDALAQTASRRNALRGAAAVAGGAMLAGGMTLRSAKAQDGTPEAGGEESPFGDEVDVLNYALTLEHLESAFYRDGLATFADQDFLNGGFDVSVRAYIAEIGAHEATHVEALTTTITDLGGTPVEEGVYDYGYDDFAGFLATAGVLENTGVSAYTGAAQYLINEDELLTTALTIHGVEARHAAYLNILNGEDPFPEDFDPPLTPDEVLDAAAPFFAEGDGAGATPEATPEA